MAAAYAALVSLINTLHISRSVSVQTPLIQSLHESLNFIVEFLEERSKVAKDLEDRIVDAAHAAEDAIEDGNESLSWPNLLGKIREMDSIKAEVTRIKETSPLEKEQLQIDTIQLDEKNIMVGSREEKDGIFEELMESQVSRGYISAKDWEDRNSLAIMHQLLKYCTEAESAESHGLLDHYLFLYQDEMLGLKNMLTRNARYQRVIAIVGMGGIGKTTLAKKVFTSQSVAHYYDIRAWVVVSQEYNLKDILTQMLLSIRQSEVYSRNFHESANGMSQMNEENLGKWVYKALAGRRYLIVIDDIWDIDVWNMIMRFFPTNNQESRVMVTTRLSDLATQIGAYPLEKRFLCDNGSWDLLKRTVYGEEACPSELEMFGKIIATKCRGLPLAIVLIGGLLAKSDKTPEYWKHVAEEARWAMHSNCEQKDGYLNIFYFSYNHLPIHLKPCFLYMGLFREDQDIRVSEITKLWVCEGILKPISGRIMEDVAEEHLKDLIGRNLIMISRQGLSGKIKSCQIHDLLRDLCLREAEKENFLCVLKPGIPNVQRRIVLSEITSPTSLTRSLTCSLEQELELQKLRLLWVLNVADEYINEPSDDVGKYSLEEFFGLINSRFLSLRPRRSIAVCTFPVDHLRNVQTIIVRGSQTRYAPSEIWRLLQLRHIKFESIHLPEPEDDIVLENLLTMKTAENLVCCDKIVDKILNIRKLRIGYNLIGKGLLTEWSRYFPKNISCFKRLESLALYFPSTYYKDRIIGRSEVVQNLVIPQSIKKLILKGCGLGWEDMTMIGSLPHLEVLKLYGRSFVGTEWSPIEGELLCLKYLLIYDCCDLIHWRADETSFPRLERIVFRSLCLEEIPIEIGDIQTLQSIELEACSKSMVHSAKLILKDQEVYGNLSLKVHVIDVMTAPEDKSEFEELVCKSFHVAMRPRPCSGGSERGLQLRRRAALIKGKLL